MTDRASIEFTQIPQKGAETFSMASLGTENEHMQDSIMEKQGMESATTTWDTWSKQEQNKDMPDAELLASLKKHNIYPDQYFKNKVFYHENRILLETTLTDKDIREARMGWQAHFDATAESREEYSKKAHFINTLVARGLGPLEFAKQYSWKAYFTTTEPTTITSVIKVVVEKFVKEVFATKAIAQAFTPEEKAKDLSTFQPTSEDERTTKFTRTLWELANMRREAKTTTKVGFHEKQTQEYLSVFGVAPDVVQDEKGTVVDESTRKLDVLENAGLQEQERTQAIKKLFPEIKKEDEDRLMEIHSMGIVYSPDKNVVGKKAREIKALQEKIGDTNPAKREALIRAGIAGENDGIGDAAVPGPKSQEELMINQTRWDDMLHEFVKNDPNMTLTPEQRKVFDALRKEGVNPTDEAWQKVLSPSIKTESASGEKLDPWDEALSNTTGDINFLELSPVQKLIVDGFKKKGMTPTQERIKLVKNATSIEDVHRAIGENTTNQLLDEAKRAAEERRGNGVEELDDYAALEAYYGRQIESLDDFAREIVENLSEQQKAIYGEYGLFPLFKKAYKKDAQGNDMEDENGNKIGATTWREVRTKRGMKKQEEQLYVAVPGNIHRWIMDRMMEQDDLNPTSQVDFMQKVALKRIRGGFLPIGNAMDNKAKLFKTKIHNEDLGEYEDYVAMDFWAQVYKDVIPYNEERNAAMEYGGIMPAADSIKSFMQKFHASPSKLTRGAFDSSYLRWGYYTPQHYESALEKANYSKKKLAGLKKEELERQDGAVGAAKALAECVYRYISIVDGSDHSLVGFLGKDSPFFQKEVIRSMRDSLSYGPGITPDMLVSISDAQLNKVFPDPGKIKMNTLSEEERQKYLEVQDPKNPGAYVVINKEEFVKFFNVFDAPQQDEYKEKLLRKMVKESIAHKHRLFNEDEKKVTDRESWYIKRRDHGKEKFVRFSMLSREEQEQAINLDIPVYVMDTVARDFAESAAYYGVYWKGEAALNDPDGTGHDWQARAMNTKDYRLKGPDRSRNNYSGNLRTVDAYRATIVDFMRGILTLTPKSIHKDEYGLAKPNPETGEYEYEKNLSGKEIFKTPMNVVHEIVRAVEIVQEKGLNSKEYRKELGEVLRRVTGQLFFREQTQEKYFGDHWVRGHTVLEDNLLGGAELDFKSFSEYDVLQGVYRIDADKFGKAFEKFIKPWRYGISTWGQLDLSQEVDIPDGKGGIVTTKDQNGNEVKPIMAQYLFGDEVLDHPRFWKKAKQGDPGAQLVEVANENGKLTKEWKIPHLLDPAEFNTKDGKVQLYLNAVLISLAGTIVQHRKLSGRDKRYPDEYYHALFGALESLPSKVLGDTVQGIDFERNSFTRQDIAWLRRISGTEEWKMATIAIFKAIFKGVWEGATSQRKYITNV